MNIFEAAQKSTLAGDMYALQQFLFELGICNRFYFKLEEGSFVRPSIYIKLVSSAIVPHNRNYRDFEASIMVQYFSEDYFDTQMVSTQITAALTGSPTFTDVVLPRYDFSTTPPTLQDRSCVMGARIDPSTVTLAGVIQEDNRAYNAPITFTMRSPLATYQQEPLIEDINFSILVDEPYLPQAVNVDLGISASLDENYLRS